MKKIVTALLIATLLFINLLSVAQTAYAAPPAVKPAQAADELLKMMPDANAVVVINVAQLSVQIQALLSHDADLASKFQSQLNHITAQTGVNLQAIEQVVIAFSLNDAANFPMPVIALSGTFDQDQILARLAGSGGKKWKAKRYKGQRIYLEPGGGSDSSRRATISFFDEGSKIAFGSTADVKRVINARTGNQSSVMQDTVLMSALQQAGANASIRFAFTIPEEIRQKLGAVSGLPSLLRPLTAITQVVGSADIGDNGIQANVSLNTSSAKEAGELVALITNGLTLAKLALGRYPGGELIIAALNGISVAQAGNAANVTVNIPADVIRRLIDEYKSRVSRP